MSHPLRLLLIEDNPADAELVLLHLRRHGFEPDCVRVQSETELLAAFSSEWDVILSDYELPQFDGMRALELVRERYPSMPFILVSGTIGEERAVAAMKRGASDYLLKDRLSRLGPAVMHAMEQHRFWVERNEAQRELRESEARYRQLIEGLPVAVYTTDAQGYLTLFNAAAEKLLGRAPEIGSDRWWGPWRLRSPEGTALAPEDCPAARVLRTGAAGLGTEAAVERPDGTRASILVYPTRLHDATGAITGAMNVMVDISARKAMEAELHESRERFRELIETIHEVFWITDVRGTEPRLLYVSPNFETIWGRPTSDIVASQQAWLDTIHPLDRERIQAAWRAAGPATTYDEEYRIVRPDGTIRWIHGKSFPVRDPDGRISRLVGVSEDVTERKSLEDQFLRAQRLEAIGTLAGGVAHDLNNILAPVLMAAGLLRDGSRDDRDDRLLAMIEQSAHRGAEVIRQLLTFSRGGEGERVFAQLRYILKEMSGIIAETFPRNISLTLDIAAKLEPVLANATQIHQILMNLCVNARDAMPAGGELTLSAANVTISPEEAAIRPELAPGRFVMIAVRDTGTGIEPEHLRRIFDPFFTTKAPGKGTGLGLATVLDIVRAHGGRLTVDSTVGCGTTFSVYLPVAETTSDLSETVTTSAPQGAGETILLVDDEPAILASAKFVLEKNGYHVIAATEGVAALELFADASLHIDAVLTDVMMPVMGGLELARALRARRPNLPIVATTGMAADEKRLELTAAGVSVIVDKPAAPQALLTAVHAALHPPPAAR